MLKLSCHSYGRKNKFYDNSFCYFSHFLADFLWLSENFYLLIIASLDPINLYSTDDIEHKFVLETIFYIIGYQTSHDVHFYDTSWWGTPSHMPLERLIHISNAN